MKKKMTQKVTIQLLVTLAILLALRFIIRNFSITLIPKVLVLSPSFIVNTVIGSVAGPIISFFTFGLYDISTFIMGKSSQFIPAWTLMEAIQGFLYGLFFYRKKLDFKRPKDWGYTTIAVLCIMLVGTFIGTPLLTKIYYHFSITAQYASGRIFKVFEIPVRIVVIMYILPKLQKIKEYRTLIGIK